MDECTPSGSGRWPSKSPCGAHGSCVSTSAGHMCLCDSGWSSAGDFSQAPRSYCHVNQLVLMCLWIVALLCVVAITRVWWRIVKSYVEMLAEAERKANGDMTRGGAHTTTQAPSSQHSSRGFQPQTHSKGIGFVERVLSRLHWIWTNPTRRTLTIFGIVMTLFATLSIFKITVIALHFYDGANGTASTSLQNVGFAVVPTLFYCLGSYGFLVLCKFSSLIWCASAQAFYPRAEGLLLRKKTLRELRLTAIFDFIAYALPVVSCVIADYYLATNVRPGDFDSYEIVVALHFQFKGFVPVLAALCDLRVGLRFSKNLRAHVTQERLTVPHPKAGLYQPEARTHSRSNSNGDVNAEMSVTTKNKTISPAPSPLRSPMQQQRLSRSATIPPTLMLPAAHAPNRLSPPAPNSIAAVVAAAAARNAARRSTFVPRRTKTFHVRARSGSVDLTKKPRPPSAATPTLETTPAQQSTSQRSSTSQVGAAGADSPQGVAGGETAVQGDCAVAEYSPEPSPTANSAPSSPLGDFSPPKLSQSRRLADPTPSVASHVAHLHVPTLDAVDEVPGQMLLPNPRRLTASPIFAPSNLSLQHSPVSASFPAVSFDLTRQRSLNLNAADATEMMSVPRLVAQRANSDGVGAAMNMSPKNSSQRLAHLRSSRRTTADTTAPLTRGASLLRQPSAERAERWAHAAPSTSPTTLMRSQADLQEEHRAKLDDFLKRLLKHNRSSVFLSTLWLFFNSLFAWIPLLRGFVPFVLPLQIFISISALRTLLATLAPRPTASKKTKKESKGPTRGVREISISRSSGNKPQTANAPRLSPQITPMLPAGSGPASDAIKESPSRRTTSPYSLAIPATAIASALDAPSASP